MLQGNDTLPMVMHQIHHRLGRNAEITQRPLDRYRERIRWPGGGDSRGKRLGPEGARTAEPAGQQVDEGARMRGGQHQTRIAQHAGAIHGAGGQNLHALVLPGKLPQVHAAATDGGV